MSIFTDQKTFMVACEQMQANGLNQETGLWMKLIIEEFQELEFAYHAFRQQPVLNLEADIAKEAIDLIYVVAGLLNNLNLPADLIWNLVHESNMAKVNPVTGVVVRRPDGKILKPEGWTAPDILSLLLQERRNARS